MWSIDFKMCFLKPETKKTVGQDVVQVDEAISNKYWFSGVLSIAGPWTEEQHIGD